MRMNTLLTLGLGLAIATVGSSAFAGGDAANGKKIFNKRCKLCHSTESGKNKMGPYLAGIFGAKSGTTTFSKYKGLKGSNYVWNEKNLDQFLANPKKFVGKRSMSFKLKKANERADVIEYLKTLK